MHIKKTSTRPLPAVLIQFLEQTSVHQISYPCLPQGPLLRKGSQFRKHQILVHQNKPIKYISRLKYERKGDDLNSTNSQLRAQNTTIRHLAQSNNICGKAYSTILGHTSLTCVTGQLNNCTQKWSIRNGWWYLGPQPLLVLF